MNLRSGYPVNHPTIYFGEDCKKLVGETNDVSNVEGLISCKVLPPRDLYFPLLPVKMHNKLMFSLCRTCTEELNEGSCNPSDESLRTFSGTWVSAELKKAVELGYKVIEVYEIWEYKLTQYNPKNPNAYPNGLFAEYIKTFLKINQEASGRPESCINEEDKKIYPGVFRA